MPINDLILINTDHMIDYLFGLIAINTILFSSLYALTSCQIRGRGAIPLSLLSAPYSFTYTEKKQVFRKMEH